MTEHPSMDCLRRTSFRETLASLAIPTAMESCFTKETWIYLRLERVLFFDSKDFLHVSQHPTRKNDDAIDRPRAR